MGAAVPSPAGLGNRRLGFGVNPGLFCNSDLDLGLSTRVSISRAAALAWSSARACSLVSLVRANFGCSDSPAFLVDIVEPCRIGTK
jgi:hypothetical protein